MPDPLPAGSATTAAAQQRTLAAAARSFQGPSLRRSAWQFATTFLAFVAVTASMYVVLPFSPLLALALAVPGAGLTVRLFIIQHDCGHGSFFRVRRMNDWLGRFCSVLTFTPYAFWRRQHANHHACFNNLDRRDNGLDIYSTCATLREYLALPPARRWLFRACRHPVVTQLLLPPVLFLVLYRIPFDTTTSWARERRSVYLTNLALAAVVGGLMLLLGVWPVVMVQLPIMLMASVVGVWLFSAQHRFEAAQWSRQEQWNPVQASLEGSSYLRLPRVLQWFTGNIGFHHVHHLAAKVPNYRLQECHEARPEMAQVTTLGLREALLAPGYMLWNEEEGRMMRFAETRRTPPDR